METQSAPVSPAAVGRHRARRVQRRHYRALVRAEPSTMPAHGKPLPVIPGMTGSVAVRTGERSVMGYLLRPMLKSKEAFQDG